MLTIDALYQLAKQYGLQFHASFRAETTSSPQAPKPQFLTIWFREECVEAWVSLMTQLTEVPVTVYGTRQVTGSGATDNRLYPGYLARLEEVNRARASLGLDRVFA